MVATAVDTRALSRMAPDTPTIGAYLRRPGVQTAINARRAAARWRLRRRLDGDIDRAAIANQFLGLLEDVIRWRRLDAIAVDLHQLAERCAALQDLHDAELAAYIDAHEEPPAE